MTDARARLFATAALGLLAGWSAPAEPGEVLAGHGIVLSGEFPPRVRAALAAGVRALPRALRTPPGGPLALTWDPRPRRYGQNGDGLVSPVAPPRSERARFRLEALSDAEREALWWRRAAVHAIVARWDRARGWSRSRAWRRVALWEPGGLLGDPERRSTDPWSVSRPAGARSPHLDLVTFAEEAFVPAGSVRENAVPVNATVRCQERAKWRFVYETLAAEGLAKFRPHGACPAFDRWADLDHLESIEVLLVAASSRQPESLFGHLMLRPVYGPGARVTSPGFQTVVQLVALTSKADGSLAYLWRGITGGFPMVVVTTTLASIRRDELELEQRDIRRFRLQLGRRERARLMDRVWDLERLGTFHYRFFSQNCAAALVWLVGGALDPEVRLELPSAPWVMPGAVLDELAAISVRRPGGEKTPLVAPVPGGLASTGTRARRAHERRQRLVARLPAALRPVHRASLDPDPRVRRRAYERLPALVPRTGAPRAVYHWLALTARIERYLADLAVADRRERARSAGAAAEEDPRARLARRRAWLRGDPARADRMAALVWDSGRRTAPGGSAASATAAEATFYRLTEIQARLVERHWPDIDPRGWLRRQASADRGREADWSRRALPRSGAGRHDVALGADADGPALVLGSTGLGTHLGEPLAHGYRPETEVRILEGRVWITPGDGWPQVSRATMTFLGLRTIERDLPAARRGVLDRLGWGTAIRWDRDKGRGFTDRLSMDGELLWVLDSRESASAHTVVGTGVSAQARWTGPRVTPAIAPVLSFRHRTPLGGSLANALRIETSWAPAAVFHRAAPDFGLEADVRVAVDVFAGTALGRAFVVGPTIAGQWQAPGRARAHALLRVQLL